MRVIDLLNKIANDEEMDFEIIVVGEEEDKHYYDPEIRDFINMRTGEKLLEDGYGKFFKYFLHDTVTVIGEDPEDKEITEHHDIFDYFTGYSFGETNKELLQQLEHNFQIVNEELDYLINKINKD